MLSTFAGSLVVGVHLISAHMPGTYTDADGNRHALETITPGIYVKTDEGYTAGAYLNSFSKPSAYAGYTLETPGQTYALTLGVVSGYGRTPQGKPLMPFAVPSIKFKTDSGYDVRLSWVPQVNKHGSHVIHLSVEF